MYIFYSLDICHVVQKGSQEMSGLDNKEFAINVYRRIKGLGDAKLHLIRLLFTRMGIAKPLHHIKFLARESKEVLSCLADHIAKERYTL